MNMLDGGEMAFAFVRPDGSKSTIFGNTRAMIAFDDARLPDVIEYTTKAHRSVSGKVADGILARPFDVVAKSTVSQWRDYAGPPFHPKNKEEQCDECNGSGEEECYACGHEETCEECNGTGNVTIEEDWPERPYVLVGENAFDTRLIAPLLAMVPDGEVEVEAIKDKMLGLRGQGWRIVVMGIVLGTKDDEKTVRFI